jgi:nicotinate-nucleotide adenylyltransferase
MTDRVSLKGLRLGLLGGTFDPIHVGHLMIAEVALAALALDRVMFIPAGDPPHKGESVTDAEHRYSMALLATGDHPAFLVSRRELEREGPSYSLTTIGEYREEVGPSGELFFIAGADTLVDIRTWHRWEEVLQSCRFAALARPGSDFADLLSAVPEKYHRGIDLVTGPGLAISSTDVRERVQRGEPIRYLVPTTVDIYIRNYGLYQN